MGVIIEDDGITLIDSGSNVAHGRTILQLLTRITGDPSPNVRRVVLSSSRVVFAGGTSQMRAASITGSKSTSDQLDIPADPAMFRRLLPHMAAEYSQDFTTREVTHVVDDPASLTSRVALIPIAGEADTNLVAHLADEDVIFLGALGSFGVTPLLFDSDPIAWIKSLESLAEGTELLIPGHGPPGGQADLEDMINYLKACMDAEGDPARLAEGPWDLWSDRRFDAVNVERATMISSGDQFVPRAMLELLGFT